MIKRQTWILIAVFIVLAGFAFFWTKYEDNRRAHQPTPTPSSYKLFTVDESAFKSIRIADTNNQAMTLVRDTAGNWSLSEPIVPQTDVSKAQRIATSIAGINVLRKIDASSDLEQYGLTQPQYTITINADQTYVISVGAQTPTQNGYYIKLGDGSLAVVDSYALTPLLTAVTNPPIATPTVAPTAPPAAPPVASPVP